MLFLLLILFLFCFTAGQLFCDPGERLHTPRTGPDVCLPCEDGEFMPEENHSHRVCRNCTSIENHVLEITVTRCTRTHDTVILCQPGYYRYRARNFREKDTCKNCTKCEFPARDCQGYDDTVCCPPNHDAVMISGGLFSCQERPYFCGPGQYFSEEREECLPCPDDTFMYAHNHRHRDCLKCETLSNNGITHAVITQPCTRHSPTIFGCESGYCKDSLGEFSLLEAVCSPCSYMLSDIIEGQTVERQNEESSKKELIENNKHNEGLVIPEHQYLDDIIQCFNISENSDQTRTELKTPVYVSGNDSFTVVQYSGKLVFILLYSEILLLEILLLCILFRFRTLKPFDSVHLQRFRQLCLTALFLHLCSCIVQFATTIIGNFNGGIRSIVTLVSFVLFTFSITFIITFIWARKRLIRCYNNKKKADIVCEQKQYATCQIVELLE